MANKEKTLDIASRTLSAALELDVNGTRPFSTLVLTLIGLHDPNISQSLFRKQLCLDVSKKMGPIFGELESRPRVREIPFRNFDLPVAEPQKVGRFLFWPYNLPAPEIAFGQLCEEEKGIKRREQAHPEIELDSHQAYLERNWRPIDPLIVSTKDPVDGKLIPLWTVAVELQKKYLLEEINRISLNEYWEKTADVLDKIYQILDPSQMTGPENNAVVNALTLPLFMPWVYGK